MKNLVQVISTENIKPSSQIPHHPTKLKFSYLDQLLPPIYIPLIFFYQADESRGLTSSNHVQISQKLKQSLSDTLPSFYPLAGRVKDNNAAVCNDAGVEFIDARVHAHLMDVVQEPDMEELKQFLPLDPACVVGHGQLRPLLLVQITFFDCGGIVVGACFSHKIADFASAVAFVSAWGATYRGEAETSHFSFGTSSYFPASWILSHSKLSKFFLCKEKLKTKRFVFDKEQLALLKQVATSSSESDAIIKDPTRVELVSAFIWKHFIEVAKFKNLKAKKTFVAFHAVNLRPRTSPPQLLENVFGNCVMAAFAKVPSGQYECVEDFNYLVGKLRSSIRRVRDDYITKPLNKESAMKDLFKMAFLIIKRKLEWCFFTSWCGFPVYDVDYGWGRPIWFSTTAMPAKNPIVLVSSRSGDAIEAIVTTRQDVLAKLESQIKLISTNCRD